MILKGTFYNLLVITALLVGIAYYIGDIPRKQAEQGQWVTHTHQVLNQLNTLSLQLTEAYAEHDDPQQTKANLIKTTDIIKALTKDNPTQHSRIELLREALDSLTSDSTHTESKNIDVKQRIYDMRKEEEHLLRERQKSWHAAVANSQMYFLIVISAIYLLAIFAYSLARRETRSRDKLIQIETQNAAAERSIAARMKQVIEMQQDIILQRLNLQNAMEVITERSQSITRADGAVIEMQQGDEMIYRAASGKMVEYIGMRIKAAGSMSGLCVSTATALRCDDSENDERVDKVACRKVGLRSMIVVPLMHNEESVGVLKLTSSEVNHFTTEDMQTLQLMAGVLSATLRDAAASDALQDSNNTLNMNNSLLQKQKLQLEFDKKELKTLADNDGLTGLRNHRFFKEFLTQKYNISKRYENQLSVIMCDVDHFKKYNDTYGHPAGDAVLKQVAKILKDNARPSDCVARYGGEEFAIILPQTPLSGAVIVANRICEAIRNAEWSNAAVTISIGVSGLENGAAKPSVLMEEADKALYASKSAGRDRVTVFED